MVNKTLSGFPTIVIYHLFVTMEFTTNKKFKIFSSDLNFFIVNRNQMQDVDLWHTQQLPKYCFCFYKKACVYTHLQ